MTLEESEQVRAYIATLQAQHFKEAAFAKKMLLNAQKDITDMVSAMEQIEMQAKNKAIRDVKEIQGNILAIINHYCPDYNIPF